MSDTYTKLFKGIVASTIVGEPVATRWAWVTLLAEANREGCVYASIPGLARIANITLAETEAALACFLSPDPYSRTKDHEGRRIEVIDGGWRLLNHAKYRAIRDEAERAEYKRLWDLENRPQRKRDKPDKPDTNPTQPDKPDTNPTNPTDPTPGDRGDPTNTNTTTTSRALKQKHVTSGEVTRSGFEAFWAAYPRKEGKLTARKAWATKRLDPQVEEIVQDVVNRARNHRPWREGFIPHAATYLRGERWTDAIDTTRGPAGAKRTRVDEIADFMGGRNGLDDAGDQDRAGEAGATTPRQLPLHR